MDQDAFRKMLDTPRGDGASSSGASKSRFGAAPPKRAVPTTGKATDFKPRKQPFKPKKAPDGSVYRDRAAERRKGKDGDFAEAEKLLEDFKTRSEREDVDKETFEKQMQYLGGDAQHSILVKGLDMALLERMKHEQAKKADAALGDVEDELDKALEAGPSASSSSSAAPAAAPEKPRKKTRDELLAELKAMRGGGGAQPAPAEKEKDPRFKPLGGDVKGKGKEQPAPLGAGWRKVAVAAPDGEKKRRKKKKVVPAAPPADTAAREPGKALSPAPQPAAPGPVAPPVPPAPDFNSDDDIFGEAGDYKGLDTDSDSDTPSSPKPSAPAPPPPADAGPAKRKYFSDDEEDEPISTAPSAITDLAAKQAAANAAGPTRRSGGGGGEGEEGEEEDVPMRLQGLSGSGPSVKELLEMDKAAEAEEKRKAKKAKYQAAAAEKREMREKNMTEADKANRVYQEMMNHLAKKQGKPDGPGDDE
ncbi:hypothetical protein JCM10213_001262 [Rhodosporidiobolus nylandii]